MGKVAGQVTSKGVEYVCPKNITNKHFETKPPIKAVRKNQLNLTGYRFGDFQVVGLAAIDKRGSKYAMWVCRCSCGKFEHRKAKSVRNKSNQNDKCQLCRHRDELVINYNKDKFFMQHGEYQDE